MNTYTIRNEWDKEFELTGTLEEIANYFDVKEYSDIEDVLEYANDEKNGNGTIYYIAE